MVRAVSRNCAARKRRIRAGQMGMACSMTNPFCPRASRASFYYAIWSAFVRCRMQFCAWRSSLAALSGGLKKFVKVLRSNLGLISHGQKLPIMITMNAYPFRKKLIVGLMKTSNDIMIMKLHETSKLSSCGILVISSGELT